MLTMRSSTVTKMAKPPPPVPPRPSKTIVAEALAKRRRNQEDANIIPVRTAPPPPPDLFKSQYNGCENFTLKKSAAYERSISEEIKSNTRTIIFQSSNMKSVNTNALVRKESLNKRVTVNNLNANQSDSPNNKVMSVLESKKSDVVVTTKNILNSRDVNLKTTDNCIKITQKETNDTLERTHSSDEVTINSQSILMCASKDLEEEKGSPMSTMGKTTCDEDTKKFDEKWEEMLKDKNHVNMLIDEMFASVLEVSKNEEMNATKMSTTISTDNATITINSCDNIRESSSVETNGSTVLIIETADKSENYSSNSLKKGEDSYKNLSDKSNSSTMEKKGVQFDDKKNAEFLIQELESMRMEQERILKRQRKPSQEIYDFVNLQECNNDEEMKNCHINIVNLKPSEKGVALDYERFNYSTTSLH
ncbi:hypothetical protein HHI36_010294 [Cryptolaemus montrouzieri]|uniref:Uncharacterized protein n=1 Tax=Cryptolaemus montrouzieri TaxID=559131 RepID=A0ABD2MIA9_9CUCU